MTVPDYVMAALVVVLALLGARAGLLSGAFSVAGVLAGVYLGVRVGLSVATRPEVGAYAPPLVVGAAVLGGALGRFVVGAVGRGISSRLRRVRAVGSVFGLVDGIGGAVLGAVVGLAVVVAAGFVAAQTPLPVVRQAAQDSAVLGAVEERVPSRVLDDALLRLDPRQGTRTLQASEPDSSAASRRSARRASPGVVRVSAFGTGFGSAGSGWVAAPDLVVTNAHVVDGAASVGVSAGGPLGQRPARVVVFDERNDVAVLEVDDLRAPALPTGDASAGRRVSILGYPGGGPLSAGPGRVGWTDRILTSDASGGVPVLRTVTSVSGEARPGNSGGPVVNGRGEVVATVFGDRAGPGRTAYAIPSSIVEARLRLAALRIGEP